MLNIINNLPEALTPSDLPDCLKLLNAAYYFLNLRPALSFSTGYGSTRFNVGDELTASRRWWARRPRGDRQRMLPFPGFRRAQVVNSYLGHSDYFEIEVTIPRPSDGQYYHCPHTLVYQSEGEVTRNTLSALRIHGLTASNITELKNHLGWH